MNILINSTVNTDHWGDKTVETWWDKQWSMRLLDRGAADGSSQRCSAWAPPRFCSRYQATHLCSARQHGDDQLFPVYRSSDHRPDRSLMGHRSAPRSGRLQAAAAASSSPVWCSRTHVTGRKSQLHAVTWLTGTRHNKRNYPDSTHVLFIISTFYNNLKTNQLNVISHKVLLGK